MNKLKAKSLFLVMLSFLLVSCKKEKRYSKETWYSMFILNQKVGFVKKYFEMSKNKIKAFDYTYLDVVMGEERKKVSATSIIEADKDGTIEKIYFLMRTPDQKWEVKGKNEEGNLILNFFINGENRGKKIFDIKKQKIYASPLVEFLIILNKLPSKFKLLDLSTLSLEDANFEFLYKDKDTRVYKIKNSTEEKIWVKNGEIVKLSSAGMITLLKQPKSEAIKIPSTPLEILSTYAISPKGDVLKLYNQNKVLLKVSGIDTLRAEIDFATQKLIKRVKDTAYISLSLPQIPFEKEDSPLPDSVLKYLKPTKFMQSDAPEIKKLALKITKNCKNRAEKVEKILTWIKFNIKKKASVSWPSALEVLKSKYGDCNEHAVLFGALARASGVPTKIIVGLFFNGEAYFYHAWNAVYIQDKWVFVDPIFNQFPADLGHLMLKSGGIEKQAQIMSMIGKITIEILK